jgi:hypothetical protein
MPNDRRAGNGERPEGTADRTRGARDVAGSSIGRNPTDPIEVELAALAAAPPSAAAIARGCCLPNSPAAVPSSRRQPRQRQRA